MAVHNALRQHRVSGARYPKHDRADSIRAILIDDNPDAVAKSQEVLFSVIPGQARTESFQALSDSHLRGSDDS